MDRLGNVEYRAKNLCRDASGLAIRRSQGGAAHQ